MATPPSYSSHRAEATAGVTFDHPVEEGPEAIDASHHAKYDRYGPGPVSHVTRRGGAGREESPVSEVVVVIGAGSIGQAIARRVSAGKHVVLADLREQNANVAAEVNQAPPATILAVDLCGTALVLEEFGNVIAAGGAGVVIASQSPRSTSFCNYPCSTRIR